MVTAPHSLLLLNSPVQPTHCPLIGRRQPGSRPSHCQYGPQRTLTSGNPSAPGYAPPLPAVQRRSVQFHDIRLLAVLQFCSTTSSVRLVERIRKLLRHKDYVATRPTWTPHLISVRSSLLRGQALTERWHHTVPLRTSSLIRVAKGQRCRGHAVDRGFLGVAGIR